MSSFQGSALRSKLDGISGILVTPFDANDAVTAAPLRPVVDRAVNAGVHVLVANGNTSEFYGLEAHEAERAVHIAAECVAGRVPLLAGVGRSVGEACQLARVSRDAGADALMVHQPPDPFVSPRGVVAYVQRIAEAGGGLPVVLYLTTRVGLTTPDMLRSKRKYVILAIFVLAAILTPPDVVSQVALGLPMCGLYEIGILVSRCTKARERA